MCFLLLLLVLSALALHRTGKLGPPPWVRGARSPEQEAKRLLAERFARGEISSDEFMERASVLNWTPGSDDWSAGGKKTRR